MNVWATTLVVENGPHPPPLLEVVVGYPALGNEAATGGSA